MQMELLTANRNPTGLWRDLAQARFFSEAAKENAEDHAIELSASLAGALQGKGEFRQSVVLLAGVPEPFRASPRICDRLLAAQRHDAEKAWATMKSKVPLRERLAACATIKTVSMELEKASDSSRNCQMLWIGRVS
ncbi:MAG: hypothetical protein ACRD15_20405 [Vicinamibacterales bacterium]